MSSHGETSRAFLPFCFFTDCIGISAKFTKVVSSINSYEPLILETKTSQSSLSFQESQAFVKSKRLGKYRDMHCKGQINSGFNEISSYSDDHWLDRCKNRICGKT